jgi:surfeit locus 1 family protein
MTLHFTRPRPIAWFFFIAAFGTCITLGSWQVERLKWKQGIITALAEANAKTPLTALPKDEAELATLQFRKIRLSGTWRSDLEFHIAPRYFKNQFGYHVITPLKLADDRVVMVNRGWIPGKKKDLNARPESRAKGLTTINGIVRIGAERNYFSPVNQPEKNIWFGRDVEKMAQSASLNNTIPAMVDVVGTQDVTQLPVPSDGTIRLKNDHLSYIITWFGIALGILVIFVVYHRKK